MLLKRGEKKKMWQLPEIAPEEMLMYLRKSQTDDPTLTVEEVLAKHEQMLNEWVEKNLPELGPIPEKNRHREVVSGETIADRPQMLELLRKLRPDFDGMKKRLFLTHADVDHGGLLRKMRS